MKASKLRTVHVIIIGVFVCIAVVAGAYFLVIKNKQAEITALEGRLQTATTTANKLPMVEREHQNTLAENNAITKRYGHYLATKMPAVSFQNRAQGMIGLWREQAETLGPLIQNWPGKTGVTMSSTISVPAAPVDPNSINTTLIEVPIGSVSVTGGFRSILTHLKAWNNFNRLVQIEPPTLSGQSPGLTATYTMKVLIFPRGETGPNITIAGGGTAAPGGTVPVPGAAPTPSPSPAPTGSAPNGPINP